MEQRKPKVGQSVVYVNPVNQAIPALVTNVWGEKGVNLVYVTLDETRTDSYGAQVERATSCVHKTLQEAAGNYWRYNDDEPKPTERPV